MSGLPESVMERTREVFGDDATPEQSVVRMLKEVREEGDAAVRRYANLLDAVDLQEFQVDPKEMKSRTDKLDPALQSPYTDIQLPSRMKFLKERTDPK